MDDSTKDTEPGQDGEHRHLHITAPVKVPEIVATEGRQDVLPAEADQRDRVREEGEPPDRSGHEKLGDIEEAKEEKDIYDKFSPARKRAILAIVSYSAFISRMLFFD